MSVLSGDERKLLSDVVVRAREVVEAACAQRVAALGVTAEKPPSVLSHDERAVRLGLRARVRQLGSVEALIAEAGFEHWHRMLFARFLADNGLLVDDQYGQPLTIDEVAEYAAESGEADKWEVAARFASAMLPGIFIQGDPILEMRLPVETRQELEGLLDRLPVSVIQSEDALGWVYQYWQAKRKDEVNKSERKIGGADLAPVTQLFTEDYMVRFLLENSLGAWWADRRPDSMLPDSWEYLRRDDDGSPAAGGFEEWPDRVAEVTVMDPCCGSGHFLVAAFGMLWRMRAEEEGLDPAAAQDAVLRDNLFGLELDPRCTQIAMFALALEAWKAGGYRDLPLPNVACCGIPARAPLSDWLALAGGDPLVEAALTRLHALFANADTLGSLIDPVRAAEQAGLESVDWHTVAPLVQKALTTESGRQTDDPAAAVFGQAAAGIARAADYLSQGHVLVATNVPYLKRSRQSEQLSAYCDSAHPDAKHDLAVAMIQRYLAAASSMAIVSPNGWLFMSWYARFRKDLLQSVEWKLLAALGTGAFSSISGEVVNVSLLVWNCRPGGATNVLRSLDCSTVGSPGEKGVQLKQGTMFGRPQAALLQIPDARVTAEEGSRHPLLSEIAGGFAGICSGDYPRFGRMFWEVSAYGDRWSCQQSTVGTTADYSGREHIFMWDRGVGPFRAFVQERLGKGREGAWIRGTDFGDRQGVAFSSMGLLPATLYTGELFDNNTAVVLPKNPTDLAALWAFAESGEWSEAVRLIDQSIKVTNATFVKVPFDRDRWRRVAEERFPDGLPKPHSDDPTQWLFKGVVSRSTNPLQVAVARLLAYRWPDQELDELDALADVDGVVCLPALGGEAAAEERLRELLAKAYGSSWSPQVLDGLLVEAGGKAGGLGKWLRDAFFKDHCKVFAKRPFIWQIWDGRPDGFSALVNYHKLDRKLLERLTYDYLGSWWIGRLNDEVREQVPGAEGRLAAAEELKAKLQLILTGEPPYDIYVRWKALAEQPLGWDPDLDDGVRLNIRPFMTAGVLRAKPSIKWEKDRGKNPDGSERLNDLHYTLDEKRAARGEVDT